MNDHDERLAQLLSDAVSDVEPAEALTEIRSRTRPRIPPRRASRTWWLTVGGSVVATAAVVTAVAVLGGQVLDRDSGPGPAERTSEASDPMPTTTAPGTGTVAAPVYYLGETPQGTRLYREFRPAPEAESALRPELVSETPLDPDYRTLWPQGSFTGAELSGGQITVELADDGLRDRPSGMTEHEAQLSIEQVIYTLQAGAQERAPVQFAFEGNPIDQVLGVPTSEPLANGAILETLALVNLTAPEEGAAVSGSFDVEGVANSFEATVPWRILRADVATAAEQDDRRVVAEGFFTAEGCCEEKLFPFAGTVDVSDLEPGEYTFEVSTSDPSGGAEGAGPHVDTRTIVVE